MANSKAVAVQVQNRLLVNFRPKNGKFCPKYFCTVIEIILPPDKLHSGPSWNMKYIGPRYLLYKRLNLILGLWLALD